MDNDDLTELTELAEEIIVNKEPLWKSERAKAVLAGLIINILVMFIPDLDVELAKVFIVSTIGLVGVFIAVRTVRNTPVSK